MTRTRTKMIWLETPFLVGVGLTIVLFSAMGWVLFFQNVTAPSGAEISKWAYLKAAPPNEFGDTLAGFAGSLAFIWLVVTVWLQATELREQREEFEKMAQAQEKQAELLAAQSEVFLEEQRQRREAYASTEFDQLLVSFADLLRDFPEPKWEYHKTNNQGGGTKGSFEIVGHHLMDERPFGKQINLLRLTVRDCLEKLKTYSKNGWLTKVPPNSDFPDILLLRIDEIIEMEPILSKADRIRLRDYALREMRENLEEIKYSEQFWLREDLQ